MIKKILINVGVSIIACIAAIFLLEAACRVFFSRLSTDNTHNKLFCEYDTQLGWRKKALVCGKHMTAEYSVEECLNSRGLRGPEYAYQKKQGVYRVLVLGDSYTEGYSVEFKELFSEAIRRRIAEKGINCEVINAGTAGYSTDQEYLFFLSEGKKYDPDLTIVMFYENDVWYNSQSRYWRGYKPIFAYVDGRFIVTNVPVPKPEITQRVKKERGLQGLIIFLKKELREKSCVYNIFLERIKNVPPLYIFAFKLGLVGGSGADAELVQGKDGREIIIPKEYLVWKKVCPDSMQQAWKITEFLLSKLKEETASIGSNLLICYVPSITSIYRVQREDTKKRYGLSDDEWDLEKCSKELKSFCEKNSIDYLDPTELLQSEAERLQPQGLTLYYLKDGHWNGRGHRAVGDILTDFIYRHYLQNARHNP